MFKRIYFFFLAYLIAVTYGQTLLLLWYSKNGVSSLGILSYYLLHFSFALFIYFILQGKSIKSRTSLLIGVMSSAGGVLAASFMTQPWHVFIVSIFFGITNVFFWTILNTIYFQYSGKEEHGLKSGVYFLFFPIFGAILSPLSGFVVEKLGYHFLFMSSMLFYAIPVILIFYLPSFIFKFESKEATNALENKIVIFFQGYVSVFNFAIIPILTLSFINTPLSFGNFFGYLAILSTFTALLNSKISDQLRKRAFFFYFFTILDSATYIPMAFVNSLAGWQIFAGMNNITTNLTNPFTIALVLDYAKMDMAHTMLAREIYLNFGRVFMLLLAIVILWLSQSFLTVLVITSMTTLLYPISAYYQKVYLK